jgi:MFS transporter, DHA1 family, multidrug resistance protein
VTQPARARGIGITRVVLLGLASSLSSFGMASVIPSLPAVGRALQAEPAHLQWVVSAYLLGLGLAQPVQGWFADRFGRRPVMLSGFVVFAVASIIACVAPTLTSFVLARFAQGLGVSVATVVARAIVRDSERGTEAAIALSFITAVMGVAPVVAPLAGGLIVDAFGWRAVFLLHVTIACLLLAWMFLSLQESRPADTRQLSFAQTIAAFAELLRDPRFVACSLVYSFTSGAAFAFITVGAALFERLFSLSSSAFGLFWAILAVAYTLGAAIAGVATRRFGEVRVLLGGSLLGVVGGVLFLAATLGAPSLSAYCVALAIQLIANGVVSPLALAAAVNEKPRLAGTASGLSSALAMMVSMVFAIVAGWSFDGTATRIGWALAAGTLCALVSAIVALRRPAAAGHAAS